MLLNLCGATSPYMRIWETRVMMMTPLDYWKNSMDLWFKAAEVQLDMGFKMMAAMPGWDVALVSARGLKDDRVTLKAGSARPALRAVTPLRPEPMADADSPKPAPVKPVSVMSKVTESTSDTTPEKVAKSEPVPAEPARASIEPAWTELESAASVPVKADAPAPAKATAAAKVAPARKAPRAKAKPAAKPTGREAGTASASAKPAEKAKTSGTVSPVSTNEAIAAPQGSPVKPADTGAKPEPAVPTQAARKSAAESAGTAPAKSAGASTNRRRRAPATPGIPASLTGKGAPE